MIYDRDVIQPLKIETYFSDFIIDYFFSVFRSKKLLQEEREAIEDIERVRVWWVWGYPFDNLEG